MFEYDDGSFPDKFVEHVEQVLRKEKIAVVSTLTVGSADGMESYVFTFAPVVRGVAEVLNEHVRVGNILDTSATVAFIRANYSYLPSSMLLETMELVVTYTGNDQFIAASNGKTLMIANDHYVLSYANEVDDPFNEVIALNKNLENRKYN